MNVEFEFIRESKFTYRQGVYTIRWTLSKKGEFFSLLIDCQEIHDEMGVRFFVCPMSPKYDKYFNSTEKSFFKTKKEALKAAIMAYKAEN